MRERKSSRTMVPPSFFISHIKCNLLFPIRKITTHLSNLKKLLLASRLEIRSLFHRLRLPAPGDRFCKKKCRLRLRLYVKRPGSQALSKYYCTLNKVYLGIFKKYLLVVLALLYKKIYLNFAPKHKNCFTLIFMLFHAKKNICQYQSCLMYIHAH